MNLKHILLITLFTLSNLMYAQETFCDGEWVEQITSYNCSSFNSSQSECVSHAGCWFEANAYVGVYLWEDRCYGGTHTINNSYCDGEMVSSVWGCTDESALNYNSDANQDDGSCIICNEGFEEETITYNCSSYSNQSSCENIDGCSWVYSWGGWVSGGSSDCLGGQVTTIDIYCGEELVVLGCTDLEYAEYNPEANIDDGSCTTLPIYGCTDINSINYDPLANTDNESCIAFVIGCTDETALNYDDWANTDDGSCEYGSILGCTNPEAINYNSSANIDDGSCSFENNSDCQNIYITLNNGWNMIGFSCSINTDAGIAFGPIQDKIIIAKDAVGNAYLPSWDFNGIGDLERGYGYLLKVSEEINNYNICE